MRTKFRQHKLLALGTVLVAGVFGLLIYRQFFYDGTRVIEQKLTQHLTTGVASAKAGEVNEEAGVKRAQIALQEYKKNVIEVPARSNRGPEIDKYTEGNAAQWCTMFASWVSAQAGSPVANVKDGSWRIANSRDFAEYLMANGTWHSREEVVAQSIKPQVGDFIVYYRGNYEDKLGHVDIVVDVGKLGFAGLVGGNLDDTIKFRENFNYQDYYGFLGFGRPEK